MGRSVQSSLPQFEVQLAAPAIDDWIPGNTGIPGFITRESGTPGPHVALLGLSHGNEIAGAIVLDRLLRAGLVPQRGRLTFGFVNLAAFARFDPRHPTLSRFVDEDLNRVWDTAVLEGPRSSCELERAREIRPLIDTVDVLLDLHSMLWPSEPLMLCGCSAKGRALARGIGMPSLVVADHGHVTGKRIIDYDRFVSPATGARANLVEAGQHWQQGTVDMMLSCIAALLRHLEVADHPALPAPSRVAPQRVAEVTSVVTAATGGFCFVQPWHGGEVVVRRNTLIALDGTTEIRTPYDRCMLVMPSLRPSRGHTAVRLARFVG